MGYIFMEKNNLKAGFRVTENGNITTKEETKGINDYFKDYEFGDEIINETEEEDIDNENECSITCFNITNHKEIKKRFIKIKNNLKETYLKNEIPSKGCISAYKIFFKLLYESKFQKLIEINKYNVRDYLTKNNLNYSDVFIRQNLIFDNFKIIIENEIILKFDRIKIRRIRNHKVITRLDNISNTLCFNEYLNELNQEIIENLLLFKFNSCILTSNRRRYIWSIERVDTSFKY